jgi:hypothetical protein
MELKIRYCYCYYQFVMAIERVTLLYDDFLILQPLLIMREKKKRTCFVSCLNIATATAVTIIATITTTNSETIKHCCCDWNSRYFENNHEECFHLRNHLQVFYIDHYFDVYFNTFACIKELHCLAIKIFWLITHSYMILLHSTSLCFNVLTYLNSKDYWYLLCKLKAIFNSYLNPIISASNHTIYKSTTSKEYYFKHIVNYLTSY